MGVCRTFVFLLGAFSFLMENATTETNELLAVLGRSQGSTNVMCFLGGRSVFESGRWGTTDIPYRMEDSAGFDDGEKETIKEALTNISSVSCLQFHEYQDGENNGNYMSFIRMYDLCISPIGNLGGSHPVNLGKTCIFLPLVIHEVLHALGFAHEHQRWDRDEYVYVNYSNIKAYSRYNYERKDPELYKTFGIEYDHHSLMHYSMRAWAIDPEYPTMVPRDPNVTSLGGHVLTQKDILRIRTLYNCTESA